MIKGIASGWPRSEQFWILVTFLTIAFCMGGSARSDVQSLAIFRPISVMMLGIGLLSLRLDHIRTHKCLFMLALAVMLIDLLHITPVPDGLSSILSDNGLIDQIATQTATADRNRPISIAPSMSLNAIFALIAPLAVLVFGVQLNREERFALLPVIMVLILFSGVWGFLQAIGSPGSILYLYQITNVESAVGLFANRNHQATLLALLFPMLAVYASANIHSQHQGGIKGVLAIALGCILVPLMLVTGSRTGLLIGFIGIISALVLYKPPSGSSPKKGKGFHFNPLFVIGGLVIVTLGAITILFSRAEAVQRLAESDQNEDLRFQIWGQILDFLFYFLPAGSGPGTFPLAYQIYESGPQLGPAIVNQAHNDWLDLILTNGYFGIGITILAALGFLTLAWKSLRSSMNAGSRVQLSRLGAATTFLVVLAASVDYAVRTPIIAMVFIICLIWLRAILEDKSSHNKSMNGL